MQVMPLSYNYPGDLGALTSFLNRRRWRKRKIVPRSGFDTRRSGCLVTIHHLPNAAKRSKSNVAHVLPNILKTSVNGSACFGADDIVSVFFRFGNVYVQK